MALTSFQREICCLIARRLKQSGERYVAGGVALNLAVGSARLSRDLDLFHDTTEALEASWRADLDLLGSNGCAIQIKRDAEGFKEAVVRRDGQELVVQWTRDSTFRFFPLVEHEDLGLTLHPFDLATNKVLALVGRLEPRDWVDVLECNGKIQPLGYLAWAACGKDPGFSPTSLLNEARRSGRYSQEELKELAFDGPAPDAAVLGRKWHDILREADAVVDAIVGCSAGVCVLQADGQLCRLGAEDLVKAVASGSLLLHEGTIRGAYPTIRSAQK